MLRNTGDLSFYLGMSFIVLALAGLILTVFLVTRSKIEQSKQDKLIEVGKWFFVSVALVVGASIVSDGFKEREQDIKELEAFDKHVATITNAKDIEGRVLLAEYFSYVAPTGSLRDSWIAYKKEVDKQYLAYKQNLVDEKNLSEEKQQAKGHLSPEKEEKLVQVRQAISVAQKPLVAPTLMQDAPPSNEWIILAGSDATLKEAQFELDKAKRISTAARIYKAGSLFRTVIPNFVSREAAEARLNDVRKNVNTGAYAFLLKGFCASPQDVGDFIQCN